jgi:hypothetical protein
MNVRLDRKSLSRIAENPICTRGATATCAMSAPLTWTIRWTTSGATAKMASSIYYGMT